MGQQGGSLSYSRRKKSSERCGRLGDRAARCIDLSGRSIARYVLAVHYFLPSRPSEALNVRGPRLDAPSVLLRIRTYDLDLDGEHARPLCDLDPRLARDLGWIDGVGDDRQPEPQVVLCDRVRDPISFVVDGRDTRTTENHFDRVDPQVHRGE